MSETEKAQMAEIRAARGRVKASLTRLENTFDEINTRNEISIRLSRLDDLFKEFERLDSNLSLEESELQEFEERYFYLNAKFNDKLDELNVQNQDWDSPLPEALTTRNGKTFRRSLSKFVQSTFPRWIHTASQQNNPAWFLWCVWDWPSMHRSSMLCSHKPMVIPR
ncbi:hypothetical protein TNCV_4686461 [Trichonephila clavipes]|nr:hypothetical protein TNCV_4686461 [Trichonephila clavipes]